MGACQDERNRLTWMGLAGESTRGGTAIVPGSLTGAQYTQTFAYDQLDRLTSGPLGAYTYGDAAHLHAATAVGSAYTASYDAAGDMTCRAPSAALTCAGSTPTGGQMTFDNEGRLTSWDTTSQNCFNYHGGYTAETFAYDGEGRRVAEEALGKQCPPPNWQTSNYTYYLGNLEEIYTSPPPAPPSMTKYFAAPGGLPLALRTGSTLSYVATDGLGSVSEALDGGGNVTYQGLYAPYGGARYSRGGSPTTRGFTGQRGDTASGLDHFNARYYDPVAGQFISADTVADGLNRYGYVHANPETRTDPTGHRIACTPDDGCDVGGTGGGNGSGAGGTGPSGGSSGSSGGGTVNCAANPPPKDANCDTYLANVLRDKDARDSALWSLYQEASRYILFGGLAGIAIDLYEVFRPAEGFIQRVFDVYDIVVDAGNVLTYAPAAFGNRGLPDAISRLVSTLNSVASFLKSAVALIRELGEFAEYALDAGWIVAEGVLSGLPGLITWIAESFAGNTILDLLAAGAHAVAAQGFKLLADYQTQENMGLDQWCKTHKSAGCVPLGPSIVPASK